MTFAATSVQPVYRPRAVAVNTRTRPVNEVLQSLNYAAESPLFGEILPISANPILFDIHCSRQKITIFILSNTINHKMYCNTQQIVAK